MSKALNTEAILPWAEEETYLYEEDSMGGYAIKVKIQRGSATSRVTANWDRNVHPLVNDVPLAALRRMVALAERAPQSPKDWSPR